MFSRAAWLFLLPVVLAGPVLLRADTQDVDTNGKLDHIKLTFNESIDDATFDVTNWAVTNPAFVLISADTSYSPSISGMNDAVFFLRVQEGTNNTAITPHVSYVPGTTKNLNGDLFEPVNNVQTFDGIPPIILAAQGAPGTKNVRIIMSEPVFSTRSDRKFNYSDFLYTNKLVNGSSFTLIQQQIPDQGASEFAPAGNDKDGSDGIVEFNVDHPVKSTDFGVDTVSPYYLSVFDASGNSAAWRRVPLVFNTELVSTTAGPGFTGFTSAVGYVFAVLFFLFVFCTMWRWWTKRAENVGPSQEDGGGGSVPDTRRQDRKGSIQLSSPQQTSGKGITASDQTSNTHSLTTKEVLQKYDSNHDGVIDKQELANIVADAELRSSASADPNGSMAPQMAVAGAVSSDPADEIDRRLRNQLRDDDDPKPDDGVSDIKFDL